MGRRTRGVIRRYPVVAFVLAANLVAALALALVPVRELDLPDLPDLGMQVEHEPRTFTMDPVPAPTAASAPSPRPLPDIRDLIIQQHNGPGASYCWIGHPGWVCRIGTDGTMTPAWWSDVP